MSNKIAIIIPFFGKQPSWFDYFIQSCMYNPEVDWLIFTDCLKPKLAVSNVKFFDMTLQEFESLAASKLNFNIKIRNAYKLCDFKPTYGKIFSDYILGYKFWGYGDIDLIYGDLLKFLPDKWEEEYDVIANHKSFIPGHLCFLRNSDKVCNMFKLIPSYKSILQSKNYHGFDENLLSSPISTRGVLNKISRWKNLQSHLLWNKLLKLKGKIVPSIRKFGAKPVMLKDFVSLVNYLKKEKKIKVSFASNYSCDVGYSKKDIKNWEVIWKNGCVFDKKNKQQIMYFHFQLSKSRRRFRIQPFRTGISEFKISAFGINNLT